MKNLIFFLLFIFLLPAFIYCQTSTFNYTGAEQTYTVPPCVFSISVDVKGASGSPSPGFTNTGRGGRVEATIPVTPGEILRIYVGGTSTNATGGWNGGGIGGGSSGGGGGASDIRRGGSNLTNRIVVAGGGGGGGGLLGQNAGGAGGGLIAANGASAYGGKGGNQIAGGPGGTGDPPPGGAGMSGTGGMGGGVYGGGGAGGYYGGGGGASFYPGGGGGGGGSSYITSTATGVVHSQGVHTGDGQIIINATPSSGLATPGAISGSTSLCPGSTASYSVPAVPNATSYVWTVPAGSTIVSGQGTTAVIVTLGITSGNITVSAANSCGNTPPSELPVSVYPLPPISAGNDTAVCSGNSLTLTASGGLTYSWNTGESSQAITVSPGASSWYYVTGTDNNGCNAMDSAYVTVNPLPLVNAGEDKSICEGGQASLDGAGTGSFLWSPSLGLNDPTLSQPSASPPYSNFYRLTITDNNGCTAWDEVSVTVLPLPEVSIEGDQRVCEGQAAILTASGGMSYLWNNGSTMPVISPFPSVTTVYSVTVTDNNGCSNTASATVEVIAVQGEIACDIALPCPGDSITLRAKGGTSYMWNSGESTDSLRLAIFENQTFRVTIMDDPSGCSVSKELEVQVAEAVSPGITGIFEICSGGSTVLTATGGNLYAWSTGENTAGISVSPAVSATYFVTVGNGNCSKDTSVQVTVHPNPIASAGKDTLICAGESIVLSAAGGVDYLWTPETGLSCTDCPGPVASPPASITYTVKVTDMNSCTDQDDITINVNDCTSLQEKSEKNTVLYPNPGSGRIRVLLADGSAVHKVEIFNCLGESVNSVSSEREIRELDVSGLRAGLYFLRLHDGNMVHEVRFIRE